MNDRSRQLYELMLRKGYPEEFAALVADQMHTEFTAKRMTGYIRAAGRVSLEEAADEMFAILSDRDRLRDKAISEHAQQSINKMYRNQ